MAEVTGLRSDVSQFPNSDERNKMVLTDKQKAAIENDFNEKGWNACKIWKEHPSIKETGSTERRKGSSRPVNAITEEKV